MKTIPTGLRSGVVIVPPSKSHEHRLLIADFLAGYYSRLEPAEGDNDDITATKRCLRALLTGDAHPVLDCGESGSTRRFLAPIAAALGKMPIYRTAGRLASRPMIEYSTLKSGVHELQGNISSQFVTGLLFALPLLDGDSEIRFTTPLESAGYVALTLQTLRDAGIIVEKTSNGFRVPGNQKYHSQHDRKIEGDWSSAAFWIVANSLGNHFDLHGLDYDSVQPDKAVVTLSAQLQKRSGEVCELNVAQCPDIFPILAVQAGATPITTRFVGIRRLRLKESDRTVSTAAMLTGFGIRVENREDEFIVHGSDRPFKGGDFSSYGDHRIAMSLAIGATRASSPVTIDDAECVRKSYPDFFADMLQ